MPLNYSKWDALEVSDDSDIEGHPNVDHKSLVKWKQRDIHEKREAAKHRMEAIQAEIACNDVLLPALRGIIEQIHAADDGVQTYSNYVQKLTTNPSPAAPPTDAKKKVTYDEMILSLLLQVRNTVKEKGIDENDKEKLKEALIAGLSAHVVNLNVQQDSIKEELRALESERAKKITSEDMRDGWDSKYVPAKPEPPAIKGAKLDAPKKKVKTTEIEVLNPKAPSSGSAAESSSAATSKASKDIDVDDGDGDDDDDDTSLPQMTATLVAFSKLPLRGYEQSFHFIQSHRDTYVPGAADALLVAGFEAQKRGESKYAKQCIHQSLLLQYCEKLGGDGVRVFFKRMMSGDGRAEGVFLRDVEDTYNHLSTRVKKLQDEEEEEMEESGGGKEQIQLVPENAGQTISFIIPDGPPPEHLKLEGPGTENLDIEEVRKALQLRWDVYNGFSEELKQALSEQSLEKVNKVLGSMSVPEAEGVVELLDKASILNFAEGGIRDETGKGKGKAEEMEIYTDDADEGMNVD